MKAKLIAGWVLHVLIAGLMLFAGSAKVFGLLPPDAVKEMAKSGIGDKLLLIGGGEMIAAILMLIPVTSSLGVLLVSGFWGGVIATHMTHGTSYAMGSVFLALTWLGAYLRNPLTFSSFYVRKPAATKVESEPGLTVTY